MNLNILQNGRVICEECGNADHNQSQFHMSDKVDDRLMKENLKFYKVKWVCGGESEFSYPTIHLKVGDVVITEAVGIDIQIEGRKYKVFDTYYIVAKVGSI